MECNLQFEKHQFMVLILCTESFGAWLLIFQAKLLEKNQNYLFQVLILHSQALAFKTIVYSMSQYKFI